MKDYFKDAIEKHVDESLDYIKNIESADSFTMQSKEPFLDKGVAESYLEEGKFILAFRTNRQIDQDERNALWKSKATFKCINDRKILSFDFKSFSAYSIPLMKDPQRFNCKVKQYSNNEIHSKEKRHFRLMIPIEAERRPGEMFESKMLRIGSITYSAGLAEVDTAGGKFELFSCSRKENVEHYLIIDGIDNTDLSSFTKYTDIIILAYAYITGYYPRDRWYYLSAEDSSYQNIVGIKYETLPKSLRSAYSVFPSSVLRLSLPAVPNIDFPKISFDRLCGVLATHKELSRVLLLIVEGHTLSIELRAAIYSIALEAMTNIIAEENEGRFVPITDKILARKILYELNSIVKKFSDQLSKNATETLIKKINVINSPTNKQKLLKPFEVLGINLTPREIDCIERKNDFLHGRIPTRTGDLDPDFSIEQIALTLLYCVSALILKYVGYQGVVVYYPALNEYKRRIKLTNPPVKFI